MISDKMADALNSQINAELWSAYLYLAMSLDAESKALKGVANWFYVQWLEEQDHARIFQNYLNDQDAKVELKPLAAVPGIWPGPLQMFRTALEHERKVTELIDKLVRLAFAERDLATISRLQWFVDEQVEEEKNVRELLDAFAAVNNGDIVAMRDIDKDLMDRKYKLASAL